jgi:pimeloyl-ACP methyl ester carboxylesterase
MRRLILVVALVLLALPVCGQSSPPPAYTASRVILPQVVLHEGVTADLSLTAYSNHHEPCLQGTLLAVHGMLHTAAAWEPLAAALLQTRPRILQPCRILALDLPGHGSSSLPSGALFGELTIDDYVSAVLGTLDRLHQLGIYPDTLVGHSLGGAILVLTQQRLKAADTSLRHAHHVHDVVLLGSAVLNPIAQPQWDSGMALAPIFAFGQESAELGRHVAVPVPFWQAYMFMNLATPPAMPPTAPTVAEIVDRGYFGPKGSPVALESRAMLEGLVPRPSVDALLFGWHEGTRLTMVAYEQDRVVRADKSLDFYKHLTGDADAERFVVIGGPNAVHDTHIADPALLLAGMGHLRWVF